MVMEQHTRLLDQTVAGSSENIFTYSLNDGTNESNYSITKVEGDLTIAKVKVDVPSAVNNLVYNGGEQVGVTLPADAKYTLSDNKKTNAGSYTATAELNDKDNYEWDLVTPTSDEQEISWSIAKKQLTISGTTVDNKTYDGNTNATANMGTVTGIIGSEDVVIEIDTATFDDANVGTDKTVTVTYKMSGDDSGNYIKPSDDERNADIVEEIPEGCCFAKGTKISMADGSTKNIEDVVVGEELLTYNHEKGKYEAQKVNITYKGETTVKPFILHFDNGLEVALTNSHYLFELEELKYVEISKENAEKFIGKHFFNNKDGYIKVTSVTYGKEPVEFYTLYTEYNINYFGNGMLNVSDDVVSYLNFYKFNEDLSVDMIALEKDIEKYGLCKYSSEMNISKEEFDMWQGKYANIIIGKGLTTWDEVREREIEYEAILKEREN